MPLRMLERAGVKIALGTDGASSNDNLNMFEVMKFTALIHTLDTPDFHEWPSSLEVLRYAILGGASVLGLESEIGSIESGKLADVVIINLKNSTYIPATDTVKSLVYSEEGTNVDTVIVNGDIVVERGKTTRINEKLLLDELECIQEDNLRHIQSIAEKNRELLPYLEKLYDTSVK